MKRLGPVSSPGVLRAGIAFCAAHDLVLLTVFTASMRGEPRHRADPPFLPAFLASNPALLAVLAAVAVGALALFALRRAPLWTGLAALVLDTLIFESHTVARGVILAEWHASGACLLGWVLGLAYHRLLGSPRGDDAADRFGERGARAAFASIYVASGLSKLLHSGFGWSDPRRIWHLVYAHQPVAAPPGTLLARIEALAGYVLAHPGAARALAVATLGIELGALAVLAGPRLRAIACAAIIALHAALFALTGLVDIQATVLAILIGLPAIVPQMVLCLGLMAFYGTLFRLRGTLPPKSSAMFTFLLAYPWPAAIARLRGKLPAPPELEGEIPAPAARRAMARAAIATLGLGALSWLPPVAEYLAISPDENLRVWRSPEDVPPP